MQFRTCVALAIGACLTATVAFAGSVTVVRHIPGYQCMALNLTPQQMMDPSVVVPVLAAPKEGAPKIGVAASTVAASDPLVSYHGFVEVLFPSGRTGWIAGSLLRPWHPASGTSGSCAPAQLSNGRLGFDYSR